MAENGRKWSKKVHRGYLVENGFSRFLHHGHRGSQEDNGRNGRKWPKMGCRGYLVGNGFWRFLRHSPTTLCYWLSGVNINFDKRVICWIVHITMRQWNKWSMKSVITTIRFSAVWSIRWSWLLFNRQSKIIEKWALIEKMNKQGTAYWMLNIEYWYTDKCFT